LRDRASNRKIGSQTQKRAIEVLKQADWYDFGPTFASEQLAKRHQIRVGKETLRGWMIEAGLWKPGARRIEEVHCWRPRRSAFGELVQWDTSEHDWLEGRGPVRYLVRLIDDATSWSWGRFVERDATPFNMAVLWEYLEKNGIPGLEGIDTRALTKKLRVRGALNGFISTADISPEEAVDRLAIRELIEAYAHCADRRDAKRQMSLFTTDTHFVVYMNAKDLFYRLHVFRD